jgi:hypothetical protein
MDDVRRDAREADDRPHRPDVPRGDRRRPVLAGGPDGPLVHLHDNEAVLREAGSATWVSAATQSGDSSVAPTEIGELSVVSTDPGDDTFAVGRGVHELELARAVLEPGDSLELESSLPIFIVVRIGSVVDSAGTTTAGDGTIVLRGTKILTNSAGETATLLAATLDPVPDFLPGVTTSPTTSAESGPTNVDDDDAVTTTPPTTEPTEVDTDGDGLPDDQEEGLGSDPLVADTDGDGLTDGDEVAIHHTDPTAFSSDADALSDGAEVNEHGTDPNHHDTDGDGVSEGGEVNHYGTDPLDPDTDGERLHEVTNLTDPNDPMSHP